MKNILILVAVFLFLATPAFASSTQKSSTIFLNPYYRNSMTNNVWHNYTVDVRPSDNIAGVVSAIVRFNALLSPNVNISVMVNDVNCNTPWSYYSTTYGSASQYDMSFDCGNVITKSGSYKVSVKPSGKDTGSLTGWLDLTYMNNPISIGVGGTEYSVGQNGTVFLRLLDGNSNPINLATCNATAYYPNKTQWFRQQMTQLGSGYYYYDIAVPSITGVYITGFDCLFPSTPWNSNQSLSGIVLDATVNDYEASIFFDDTNNVTINSAYLNVSVTNSIAGANLGINFNGVKLGQLTGSSGTLYGNYMLNASNFVLGDSQVYTLTHDGTGTNSPNWIRLFVNYTYNSQPSIIRGQTELHVSVPSLTNATDIASNVWNFTPVRNLTDYNQSAMNTALSQIQGNQSALAVNISSLNSSILSVGSNLTSVNGTLSALILNDSSRVWNYASRLLTDYNQTGMNSALTQIQGNQTSILTQLGNLQTSVNNIIANVAYWVWTYIARYTHGVVTS